MADKKINTKISIKTDGTGKVTADFGKVTSSINKSTSSVDMLRKKLAAISIATKITAIASSLQIVGGVVSSIKGAISSAFGAVDGYASKVDTIAKFGRNVGMSAGQLQQWQYAAQRGGMSVEGMNNALKKFASNVSKASNGEKTQLQMFNAMGIRLKDNKGHLKSTSQLMLDVADAYDKISNAQDKIRLTEELFGRSNYGIQNVFEGGSKAVKEMLQRRADIGGLLTDEDSQNAEKFKDLMLDVQEIGNAIETELMSTLLPELNKAVDEFLGFWKENKDTILEDVKTIAGVVGENINGIVNLFKDWRNIIKQVNDGLDITAKDLKFVAGETLKDAAKGGVTAEVTKSTNPLLNGLKGVAGVLDFVLGNDEDRSKREEEIKRNVFNIVPSQSADPSVTTTTQKMVESKTTTNTSNVNINVNSSGKADVDVDEAFKKDPNVNLNYGWVFAQ